ncbi:hypothetical protein [Paenibacillus campinasensis]|uniref:Uncharacterized protein n=1 Tax=Paenibacillus campinasensis TaxID=66347 RepID=A0A268ELC8_9BACL|nr:hypothetical protein [Paenibacillus campinasensis]PAD73922.1 hypothetical protein CHH67_18990 [Paenibacillus campinasensis]
MYVMYNEESPKIGDVQVIMSQVRPEQEVPNIIHTDAELSEPLAIPGMVADLKINLEEGTFFYDYHAIDTLESRVSALQQENAELNQTIGNLILESANDKATISSLEDTVGSLLLEVATLKGGE